MVEQTNRWRELLDRQGSALLLFARQWSVTAADAEDALQNGFVRFWKSRDRANDETAWLYACVRSAAMDLKRSERRRTMRETDVASQQPASFEFDPGRAERNALIESALRQLPGDQREVVVMKIWGRLTFAQIAEVQKVSINTSASRYRSALARLSNDLSEELAHE